MKTDKYITCSVVWCCDRKHATTSLQYYMGIIFAQKMGFKSIRVSWNEIGRTMDCGGITSYNLIHKLLIFLRIEFFLNNSWTLRQFYGSPWCLCLITQHKRKFVSDIEPYTFLESLVCLAHFLSPLSHQNLEYNVRDT